METQKDVEKDLRKELDMCYVAANEVSLNHHLILTLKIFSSEDSFESATSVRRTTKRSS